ncbi:MAG: methyltransferase domain-containing protein [Gammaproteobacteria bacterium]
MTWDVGGGGGIYKIGGGGFTPYGVEISAALANAAKPLLESRGGRVVCDSAIGGLRTFADEFFTAASLRSYLEHESRPRTVLEELHRVLKPDAAVLVKVPNFASLNRKIFGRRWCGFRCPDHLNYFTPESLAKMLGSGYAMQKMWAAPFNDNLWALFRKRTNAD